MVLMLSLCISFAVKAHYVVHEQEAEDFSFRALILPHLTPSNSSSINFSEAEKKYLSGVDEFTYCIDPDWMPFEKDEDGKHIGISAEYIDYISKVLRKPMRYIVSENWNDTLDKARQRKCDIVTSIHEDKERREYLNFTQDLYLSPLVLVTEAHKPKFANVALLKDVKIGVVKGYAINKVVRKNYPQLIFVDVNNIEEGLHKVNTGELYGYVDTLASTTYCIENHHYGQLKINAYFDEYINLAIGGRNDHPLLISILSKVIASLSAQQHRQFFSQWLDVPGSRNLGSDFSLSLEEIAFLQQHHNTIRFWIRPNRPPFEFIESGEAKGIAVDYIQMIANNMGFEAEFVQQNILPEEAFDVMNQPDGIFDTMLYSVYNQKRAQKVLFGDAYLSYPMMAFVHEDTPYVTSLNDIRDKTVVVEKGFLTNTWIKQDYPEIKIINTDSTHEALKAVENGLADAYVGNLAIANYFSSRGEVENVKLGFPTQYGNVDYRFVAPKHEQQLLSILNKGYRAISKMDHTVIQQSWFSVQTVEKTDYELVWRVIFGALILLAANFWWNRTLASEKRRTEQALEQLKKTQKILKEKNKELHQLSITDKLTGLYNRAMIEGALTTEFHRAKRYENNGFSIILIDLDHFKSVNDTYGHQAGDLFLKEISNIFQAKIRRVDIIGRWGGEEFLLICPNTQVEDAMVLAENLRELIGQKDFYQIGRRTASFGVAAYQEGGTIEELLNRADKALYQSKEQGRNRVSTG